MIDTREELVNALNEAAELEHTLLVQYLFAAFSLKRNLDESLTELQQAKIMEWETVILGIARQEMAHLGTVCNLLSSIGAAPNFSRPNFPQKATKYYPIISDFKLSRFSIETLYRFICFELPQGVEPPKYDLLKNVLTTENLEMFRAPDPLEYNRVGNLYSQISDAFNKIPESELFIGENTDQDTDDWNNRFKIYFVKDKSSAQKAIDEIVKEGEGIQDNRENSHYDRFLKMWAEVNKISFDPSRNVVENPATRIHRDSDNTFEINIILKEDTLKVAELFSSLYNTMILMLIQYYSYSGETKEERTVLRDTLRNMMSAVIRPLAEILTQLPFSNDPTDLRRAGPSFEIYDQLRLSPNKGNRWIILTERFYSDVEEAKKLLAIHPRIAFVAQNIEWLATRFDNK